MLKALWKMKGFDARYTISVFTTDPLYTFHVLPIKNRSNAYGEGCWTMSNTHRLGVRCAGNHVINRGYGC